ncbi:MAG: hypothetical protein AVDCRST_MAG42-1154 [uncultured Chthoniobacterales bacterium]|uniref:DUF2059 domain-containing protein n=1 Tax=uncultured Chthoniobacterales bacterium TaxID=1836801 RepID=A0A6J4HUK2_9BACT|nr:MAG: hypothetical protein AVDCRST_MAG42-1154 [uncultured Chthoniobacterales bacterium]
MKRIAISLLIACLAVVVQAAEPTPGGSHYKAAEKTLTLMDMETVLRRAIDEMLKAQISQTPGIAPYESVMRQFLMKHMGWDSLKADTIQIYMSEFTEKELEELNRFYETAVGRKMVEKMPALMGKGAELGAKRVQENMPELQSAIAEEAKKQKEASDKKK